MTIDATHFTDPGCPWAYSASPALSVLEWRYGAQLNWRLVTIGLAENASQYIDRGYDPGRQSVALVMFRDRFGMPFSMTPGLRMSATAPACRAIVATRLVAPELEYAAFRALQFGAFTDLVVFDEDDDLVRALSRVDGLDARAIVGSINSAEVTREYEADRALARQAAGGPTEFQGKTSDSDGPVRYTAPSVIFATADGRSFEVGGFQSLEAYDVAIANLDVTLDRTPAPADPLAALERFPYGLTTQEVAAIMASELDAPDRRAAEIALIELAAAGEARRIPLGDDALWRARVFETPGAAQATLAAAHAPAPLAHAPVPVAHGPVPVAHAPVPVAHAPGIS